MHYYKRHLGDYARDTGHLSALEHGIYNLLLDWYYINERPIPADKAGRIARGNPEETQTVLSEFFHRTENGWIHHRADREIQAYKERAARNRDIGARGGRPKKQGLTSCENPEETQTVSANNPDVTLTTNQEPLTNKDQEQGAPNGGDSPAGSPPADPIWGTGLAFLIRKGIDTKAARRLLGKLRKEVGDIRAGGILAQAAAEDVSDPAPWLMAAAAKPRQTQTQTGGNTNATPRRLSAIDRIEANIRAAQDADRERASANGAIEGQAERVAR